MMTLAELRRLAGSRNTEQFVRDVGPFVLLQKEPQPAPRGAELGSTKGLPPEQVAGQGVGIKDDLGSLVVALLPPLSPGGVLKVGRGAENDLILEAASSSKAHAELRWSCGTCHVVDLQSMNGTALNGAPIREPKPLSEGDVVSFGGDAFVYYTSARVFELLRPGVGW